MGNWSDEFKGSITVCDREGVIIYINQHAQNQSGNVLLGTNLLDCHPEPARSKVEAMLSTPTFNSYTVGKKGIKKMVHQSPHFRDGVFSGIIEISFEIPKEMPHFNRD
jgi:transcriptional regulator with PAS, ATPase and Fis domain